MTPGSPQYFTQHEATVSPGSTAAAALFAVDTPAISYIVLPLSDNSDTVLVGPANPPLGPIGLSWAPTQAGRFYNLKDLFIQCGDGGDGVVVQWIT